jgi:hypothetical protein
LSTGGLGSGLSVLVVEESFLGDFPVILLNNQFQNAVICREDQSQSALDCLEDQLCTCVFHGENSNKYK